jgi:hypothetical protein
MRGEGKRDCRVARLLAMTDHPRPRLPHQGGGEKRGLSIKGEETPLTRASPQRGEGI